MQLSRILSLSYECHWTTENDLVFGFVIEKRPDLILMDYLMPGESGVDICRKLRENKVTRHIPIIFVSGVATIEEKIRAFECGASDFILRPFHIQELILRVRARLSKKPPDPATEIVVGNLRIHPLSRRVYINGKEVFLTQRQFDILRVLAREKNQLVTRLSCMLEVWGSADLASRKVDSHISHLKSKIKDFDGRIVSTPGVGYCLEIST